MHPRLQLVLPAVLTVEVITGLHNSPMGGHLGVKKTLEKIQSQFYWPGQQKDVERWCSSCQLCNSRKSPASARAPLQLMEVTRPFQRLGMDILGPLPETERGNRYILVIGDFLQNGRRLFP